MSYDQGYLLHINLTKESDSRICYSATILEVRGVRAELSQLRLCRREKTQPADKTVHVNRVDSLINLKAATNDVGRIDDGRRFNRND
eukprot:CFRG7320T1